MFRPGGYSRQLLIAAAYLAGYELLEVLSLIGLYRGLGVTPWSPATGLALAFAYLSERGSWPVLFIAPAISLVVLHPLPLPWWSVTIIVLTTWGVWLAAGRIMRGMADFDPAFRSIRSVLVLFVVAAIASAVLTTVYIGNLRLVGVVQSAVVLPTSWRDLVGDVVGVLVVTPLLLMIAFYRPWPAPRPLHVLQLGVIIAALYIIFGFVEATTYQLFYMLFIPVLWVALRDGSAGVVVALNICQLGIIIGAHLRFGFTPGVGALQILMIVLVVTGLLVGVVVTERQLASQRVRDQQAALNRALRLRSAGETAAAIAHQINQPLTAISTYAAIASDALASGDSPTAVATLTKLVAECDRAANVLRSTRDLVKLGGLTRTKVELRTVLDELAALMGPECAAANIVLLLDVPAGLPTLLADETQLQQALYNLINNSIEAIHQVGSPGRITITVRVVGSDVQIDVADDGPGFAPGLEELATTPFISTKANGSGLGLAIARSVAETHGGSLSIEPGSRGARVRLTLPLETSKGATDVQGDYPY